MTSLNYEKHSSYRRVFYFRICKYCKFTCKLDKVFNRVKLIMVHRRTQENSIPQGQLRHLQWHH